jgi:hypothetical protein
MSRATPKMREFVEHLIADETQGDSSTARIPAAFVVCEKLRPHMATLMGNAGFRSLVSRALALSSAQFPWLRAVHIKADGALDGLDELATQAEPGAVAEGGVVLLTQLLGLLESFIGENLTVRLVREVSPKLSFNDHDSGIGGKNEKAK